MLLPFELCHWDHSVACPIDVNDPHGALYLGEKVVYYCFRVASGLRWPQWVVMDSKLESLEGW